MIPGSRLLIPCNEVTPFSNTSSTHGSNLCVCVVYWKLEFSLFLASSLTTRSSVNSGSDEALIPGSTNRTSFVATTSSRGSHRSRIKSRNATTLASASERRVSSTRSCVVLINRLSLL